MYQVTPGSGVFALEWDCLEIDGVKGLDQSWVRVGAEMCWRGQAVRLDTLPDRRRKADARVGAQAIQTRARSVAQRICGISLPEQQNPEDLSVAPAGGFVLTDGAALYVARLIPRDHSALVVFDGALPAPGRTCWVVDCDLTPVAMPPARAQDVICFASDAMIATPTGPVPIGQLTAGALVVTRDNGPQPVLWVGQTTLSGLALRQHRHLRPIRLRCGALQKGVPDDDLCVSPAHRVLVTGARARDLFGCDEVLACARDLVNYTTITPDLALHGVTYVHLLLERHQIIFANGLASESFHPAFAPVQSLRQHRHTLTAVSGDWVRRPDGYGPAARRCLSAGEAALLAA
ncbi:MAG: hemolysin-type calcium-binding protein [Rhodobacteraceae bacterium]|nr:MAG: hemolysin-type calcium-binding protein [Paracoccaceae bacterium]